MGWGFYILPLHKIEVHRGRLNLYVTNIYQTSTSMETHLIYNVSIHRQKYSKNRVFSLKMVAEKKKVSIFAESLVK